MSAKDADEKLEALRSTVKTTNALIATLLATSPRTSTALIDKELKNNINALDLAHDTASLVKAHSTKLSLLIINKPFTESAINAVLRELSAGPLPGLASAVEICNAEKYTKAMSEELQWRAKRVFTKFGELVKAIPLDGQILTDNQENDTGVESNKGSLASTGVVWEVCDAVMELKTIGIAGLIIKKSEEYRDLVKDALEELQEWAEEESDEEGAEASREENGVSEAEHAVDDIFRSQKHIPKDDPDKIRERLASTVKRLRLIVLMYQAVAKRRLKTLPPLPHPEIPQELKEKTSMDPGIIHCLDEFLKLLKKIPDATDDLASAFYEFDGKEMDKRMDECFLTAFSAAALLIDNWEGQKDEFTTWAYKFQVAMKKGW